MRKATLAVREFEDNHTSQSIAAEIRKIFAEYDIEKPFALVADNASDVQGWSNLIIFIYCSGASKLIAYDEHELSIVREIRKTLTTEEIEEEYETHTHGCVCHRLDLIIKKMFEASNLERKLLANFRIVTKAYRKSPTFAKQIKDAWNDIETMEDFLNLRPDCKIRWTSNFKLIERLFPLISLFISFCHSPIIVDFFSQFS